MGDHFTRMYVLKNPQGQFLTESGEPTQDANDAEWHTAIEYATSRTRQYRDYKESPIWVEQTELGES